jgi:hypothetical protein
VVAHPGNGDRGVQTARKGDSDTLTDRQTRQDLRHTEDGIASGPGRGSGLAAVLFAIEAALEAG